MAFQELRGQVGYTTAEAKAAGVGAWRGMPLFANQLDLKNRGEGVAKELGVQTFQLPAFIAAQSALLKQIRETHNESDTEGTDVMSMEQ